MRYRILAGLVALIGICGFLVVTAQQAGAQIETTATYHTTNQMFVTSSGPTLVPTGPLVPGDRIIIRQDAIQGTTVIGYANDVCTVTFNDHLLCDGVVSLNNVGDVTVEWLERGAANGTTPATIDGAITGGTFGYDNAHGSFHGVTQPNGDEVVTDDFVTTS